MKDLYLHSTRVDIEEIRHHLVAEKGEMFRFLEKLVCLETPSENKDKQADIFSLIAGKLNAMDYHVHHHPGNQSGGYLYARPQNRSRSIPLQLLLGHSDTVWPEGTIATMPYIDKGKKIYGPGVYDMKAGITQIIWALETIKRLGLPLSVFPLVLINSDEEIGSRETTGIIRKLANIAVRAYVLEPPLGLQGKLKTARKGIGRFTLTLKGKAAHAGLDPGKGASAILELSYQVQKLFALNDPEKGITINVGMIDGGISANVVAPVARAIADVRVLTEKDARSITEKILQLQSKNPAVELKVTGSIGRPPMEKNERNQKLWLLAKRLGEKAGIPLESATAGGGSDGNTTSQYTATLDGLGTTGDGAHAAHEYILKDQLLERTLLLTLLILAKPDP